MAVSKVNELIESVRKAFSKRDTKEEELKDREKELGIAINGIDRNMEGLSYKALIEEDEQIIKEYKGLETERSKKIKELEEVKKKIRAVGRFEVGIDTRKQSLDIYKEIGKEIEVKTKDLGKLTTEYRKIKSELAKKAGEIDKVYTEIDLLPLGLKDVIEWVNPDDIGSTEGDIKYFRENMNRPGYRLGLYGADQFKYMDKGLDREDMNQLLQGTIYIKPHYIK